MRASMVVHRDSDLNQNDVQTCHGAWEVPECLTVVMVDVVFLSMKPEAATTKVEDEQDSARFSRFLASEANMV